MHTIPGLVVVSVLMGALGLVGCKKKEGDAVTPPVQATIDAAATPVAPTEPSPEARVPPEPTPVEDAPDEYKALAEMLIADLAKKDSEAFFQNAMVTKEDLKAWMERGWEACPQMAPTEEQKPQVEQMIADYDPADEEVKARFDTCAAKHDFAKATYKAASSREHTSMCGGESADHVELTLTIGKEEVVVVLDDLVKTDAGWRLADMGLSCPDDEDEQ